MRHYIMILCLVLLSYVPLSGQSSYGEITVSSRSCELGEDCYISVSAQFTTPMMGMEIPLVIDNEAILYDSVVQIYHPTVGSCLFVVNHTTDPLHISIALVTLQQPFPTNSGELYRIYFHTPELADELIAYVDTLAYDLGNGYVSHLFIFPVEASEPVPVDFVGGYIHLIDPVFICGDINNDNVFDVTDLMGTINYIFGTDLSKAPRPSADVNCDYEVDLLDIVYMVRYLFRGGPEPCAFCY